MHAVSSPEHLRHDPAQELMGGQPIGIYERPQRAEAIVGALETDHRFEHAAPTEHGLEPITAVHDPDLVEHLATVWDRLGNHSGVGPELIPDTFLHPALREGMGPAPRPTHALAQLGQWVFDTATPVVEGTYSAARVAVDIALTALDLVLGGENAAYALCRPPGHHATRSAYGGYCYFNNAAIAAQAAVDAGAARVAVLDVDYHHGNGTQQIFYERGDVLYVSLHADPNRAYPYFAGYPEETGAGPGAGANLNLPLPEGTDDEAYLAELDRALTAVTEFGPELLVLSLGVDTYRLDPIGDLRVTTEGLYEQGRRVGAVSLPTVVVQEGGYHLDDLATNVHAFLTGLLDSAQTTGSR